MESHKHIMAPQRNWFKKEMEGTVLMTKCRGKKLPRPRMHGV